LGADISISMQGGAQGNDDHACDLATCNTGPLNFDKDLLLQIGLTFQPLLIALVMWIKAKVMKEDDGGVKTKDYMPFTSNEPRRPNAAQFCGCKVADSAGLLGISIISFIGLLFVLGFVALLVHLTGG
jgi:hypothetical protein